MCHRGSVRVQAQGFFVNKTKVYYNSACPVCNAGIRYQRRKLENSAAKVDWIDVHRSNEAATDVASNLEFVRERLHVVDEKGTVHVGSEAFAELWGKTRGQRALSRLVRVPRYSDAFEMALQWIREVALLVESQESALVT